VERGLAPILFVTEPISVITSIAIVGGGRWPSPFFYGAQIIGRVTSRKSSTAGRLRRPRITDSACCLRKRALVAGYGRAGLVPRCRPAMPARIWRIGTANFRN
jgi:hypothetical protein